MAKSRPSIFEYALIGGTLYVAYRVALNGGLGVQAQKTALQLCASFKGMDACLADVAQSGIQPTPPTGPTPPAPLPPGRRCTGSGSIASLEAYNPNIRQQMAEWKAATGGSYDWAAFARHVIAIGAPDPGGTPPVEFCT